MSKKTDLRIIKTETKLREALAEMMKDTSFDDITKSIEGCVTIGIETRCDSFL